MTDDGLSEGLSIIKYLGTNGDSNYDTIRAMLELKDLKTTGLTEVIGGLCRFGLVERNPNGLTLTNNGEGVYFQLTINSAPEKNPN